MESGCNVWVWLVGVVSRRWEWVKSMGLVSRRWMWVESMGVVVGRYIDYLILLIYPYSSRICSFLQQHPFFCSFFKCFSFFRIIWVSGEKESLVRPLM